VRAIFRFVAGQLRYAFASGQVKGSFDYEKAVCVSIYMGIGVVIADTCATYANVI
jgi:uncharacterized membrane protein YidH (DUF202 family)